VAVNGFVGSGQEDFLYDRSLVERLDFADSKVKFEPKISAANPGPGLMVRPLASGDFGRGKRPEAHSSLRP
jgi:hypothetical protein